MSGSKVSPLVLLVSCALLVASPVARGDLYKWVDEHGNVHISDTPPPDAKRSDVERLDESDKQQKSSRRSGEKQSMFSGLPAPWNHEPLTYDEQEPSRLIAFENLAVQFAREEEAEIGRDYSDAACSYHSRNRPFHVRDLESWTRSLPWADAFYWRLGDFGYRTPLRESKVRFKGQGALKAELSAIAVVEAAEFKTCGGSSSGYSRAYGERGRTMAKLTVRWRLFDNLQKEVVFERSVDGEFEMDGTTSSKRELVLIAAFIDSLDGLAADAEFAGLLGPEAPAAIDSSAATPARDPISLSLRRGKSAGEFAEHVEKLKSASVTIRVIGGHGSGFVIDDSGHVLTNHHVIEGGGRILVVTKSEELAADVVRSDPARDVALLKIRNPWKGWTVALSPSTPLVGHKLFVIGTPLDEQLGHSVTSGVLSAEREHDGLDYYQTDAAVNPGNSGGPVFDQHGNLVAITVAGVFTRGGGGTGINYLIPIQSALDALEIRSR